MSQMNQKKTRNTQFQNDVLRDNKYRNGFCVTFIELEAPKRVPGVRKMKQINVVSYDTNKDKTFIQARHFYITNTLKFITYIQ